MSTIKDQFEKLINVDKDSMKKVKAKFEVLTDDEITEMALYYASNGRRHNNIITSICSKYSCGRQMSNKSRITLSGYVFKKIMDEHKLIL